MAIVRFKLDSADAPRFTEDQLATLDAIKPDEIERNPESDPDNPSLTDEEFDRLKTGASIQRMRRALGLTQAEFAERFHIGLARLRDWEQGRFHPDSLAAAYLRVIAHAPEMVDRALSQASTKAEV